LKKETIEVKNTELGWILARFEGHNLGWLKVLKNRSNNYYPKEWRIRMEIP
jgi:NOL1/NOP2/fmu family ribosome biogenesis protein